MAESPKARVWIAGAAAAAFALVAYLVFAPGRDGTTPDAGSGLRPVSIAISSQSFATAPARLAHELGLFTKHGIEPRFVAMDSGSVASTALISRSVEFAVAGLSDVIVARGRGQEIVIVANVYDGFSGSLVLSKAVADRLNVAPGAPVAERLKALDGLVIGSPSAVSSYTFTLTTATKAVGAVPRLTYIAQTAMAAALETGAIQGYVASAPYWAPPTLNGTGVVWISGPKGEFPYEYTPSNSMAVQAMRNFAEANRDLVQKIAAVFDDVALAVERRPGEVKAAVAKLYPTLDEQVLSLLLETESLSWTPDKVTPDDIAHEINIVKAMGVPLPQAEGLDPAEVLFP